VVAEGGLAGFGRAGPETWRSFRLNCSASADPKLLYAPGGINSRRRP